MIAFLNNPDVVIVLVGALVGIASSLLGVFLVLRQQSMLSDAISHSILFGIIVVYLITQNQYSPFFIVGAAATGVLTVVLTELLARSGRVKNDAAIGLVYPFLFAIAILLINLFARNVHIDADAVLLGELAFSWLNTQNYWGVELPISLVNMAVITLVNLAFVLIFYKELKLSTFDKGLAAALGFSPSVLYYALLSLSSITAVQAFDAVGAVLVVAFTIVPPASSYLLSDKLWRMLLYSCTIVTLSCYFGYLTAFALDISIAASMACYTGIFFILSFILSPKYGLMKQVYQQQQMRHLNARRMLVVHLYNHEDSSHDDASLSSKNSSEENTMQALKSHLGWSESHSQDIVAQSLDNKLITQERYSQKLFLSPKGRLMAQEIVEPWRAK